MKWKGKQNSQNGNIKIRYPIYPKGIVISIVLFASSRIIKALI